MSAERPAKDKLSHGQVDYEHPSTHPEHCEICRHYIEAQPPRCEAVRSPIRGEDWCKRYEHK
jgi:hypothetical protein